MDSSVIVGVLIWLAIFIFLIAMIIHTTVRKTNGNLKIKNLRKEKGFICGGLYKHTAGLPIAEGVKCQVLCFNNRIEVRFNSMKFNLDKPKIVDICLKSDIEIQKQYVSSAGGAVGGALLFGAVGALIGGRAKQKQIRNESTYLIITYKNEDEIKYIGFDVTGLKSSANRFVYIFKNSNANRSETIDLGSSQTNAVGTTYIETTSVENDVVENDVDVIEQIEKYYGLKEKGIITEEEFFEKKKQLLNLKGTKKEQSATKWPENKTNTLPAELINNFIQPMPENTNLLPTMQKKKNGLWYYYINSYWSDVVRYCFFSDF